MIKKDLGKTRQPKRFRGLRAASSPKPLALFA